MTRPALIRALVLAAVAASPALAADLQLTVTTAAGRPAGDVVVQVVPSAAWSPPKPAEPVPLVQKDIRFDPYVMAIPVGTTVRFVNRDTYDHHVRSLPGGPLGGTAPAKSFEFRLAAAGKGSSGSSGSTTTSADLSFDVPGSVVLGCHIHGSMRGHIYIATTPWVAVTDADGRATLKGIPDGAVELRVWHPDQLSEQPTQRLQLAGAASAQATLNFSPRRRPTPRPMGG
jgi:plastocyanin